MESFVFKEINKAIREKDTSKIEFYGAYASTLSYIVHCGNLAMSKFENKCCNHGPAAPDSIRFRFVMPRSRFDSIRFGVSDGSAQSGSIRFVRYAAPCRFDSIR